MLACIWPGGRLIVFFGVECDISGEMVGKFSVPGMLKKYMRESCLEKGDYLFPKPRGTMRSNMRRCLSYSLAYYVTLPMDRWGHQGAQIGVSSEWL